MTLSPPPRIRSCGVVYQGVDTGNPIKSHPNDQQSDETMSMPGGGIHHNPFMYCRADLSGLTLKLVYIRLCGFWPLTKTINPRDNHRHAPVSEESPLRFQNGCVCVLRNEREILNFELPGAQTFRLFRGHCHISLSMITVDFKCSPPLWK